MPTDARKLTPNGNAALLAISESGAIERINQRLLHKGLFLHKTPDGSPLRESQGTYYVVDSCRQYMNRVNDLEGFAKEIGALEADEFISL